MSKLFAIESGQVIGDPATSLPSDCSAMLQLNPYLFLGVWKGWG